MASTSAAVTAVFSTTELTEAILVELDFFDLFKAQRACKKFRDVIQRSHIAQQRLFLESSADNAEYISWRTVSKDSNAVAGYCAPFIITAGERRGDEERYPVTTMNPAARGAHQETSRLEPGFPVMLLEVWAVTASPWLQMFITQPSTPKCELHYGVGEKYYGRLLIVRNDAGVRWADVLACFIKAEGFNLDEDWNSKSWIFDGESWLAIPRICAESMETVKFAREQQRKGKHGEKSLWYDLRDRGFYEDVSDETQQTSDDYLFKPLPEIFKPAGES